MVELHLGNINDNAFPWPRRQQVAAGDQNARPGGRPLWVDVGIGGFDGVKADVVAPCDITQGIASARCGVLDLPHDVAFG